MSDESSPKITIVIADDDKLARIGIRISCKIVVSN